MFCFKTLPSIYVVNGTFKYTHLLVQQKYKTVNKKKGKGLSTTVHVSPLATVPSPAQFHLSSYLRYSGGRGRGGHPPWPPATRWPSRGPPWRLRASPRTPLKNLAPFPPFLAPFPSPTRIARSSPPWPLSFARSLSSPRRGTESGSPAVVCYVFLAH